MQGKWLLQGAAGSVLGRQLIQYTKHVGIKCALSYFHRSF